MFLVIFGCSTLLNTMIKDKGSDHKMYIAEIIDIWVND